VTVKLLLATSRVYKGWKDILCCLALLQARTRESTIILLEVSADLIRKTMEDALRREDQVTKKACRKSS
jgi:hypothetical protein